MNANVIHVATLNAHAMARDATTVKAKKTNG